MSVFLIFTTCSGISLLFWFTVGFFFLILFWYLWNIIMRLRAVQEVSLRKASITSPLHPCTDLVSSVSGLSFYICFVQMSRCKSIFLYTLPSYMKDIHILPHVRIVISKSVSENTSGWPACLFYCLFCLRLSFSQFSLVSSPCIFLTKYWTIEYNKLEK